MAIKAKEHVENLLSNHKDEIIEACLKSNVFEDKKLTTNLNTHNYETKIAVEDLTTVEAVRKYHKETDKLGVLNFSSFKTPGGKFLEGAMAQEETLCHNSLLYPVLVYNKDFYAYNNCNLNKGLYHNRAIYSPDINFLIEHNCKANILTCAAPNKLNCINYNKFTFEENSKYLKSRIDFILNIFAQTYNEVLILGAYGCGVFNQDPREVASIFNDLLKTKYIGVFKKVIFAVPNINSNNPNYTEFNNILGFDNI